MEFRLPDYCDGAALREYVREHHAAGGIEKCGGRLIAENDNYQKGRLSRYYSIVL